MLFNKIIHQLKVFVDLQAFNSIGSFHKLKKIEDLSRIIV